MDLGYRRVEISECDPESWLFRHESYRDWDEPAEPSNNGCFYLLHGKPGSGKSVLTKLLVEDAAKGLATGDTMLLYFFFSADSDDDRSSHRSVLTMYRTILHQLVQQSRPYQIPIITESLRRIAHIHYSWTLADLERPIEAILRYYTGKGTQFRIYLDALDECDQDSEVFRFLRFFQGLLNESSGQKLKIFLTSQSPPSFYAKHVRGLISVTVEDHNHDDLRSFVARRLDSDGVEPQDLRQDLEALVTERAGGIFLWADLVIKDVLDHLSCTTQSLLKAFIKEQPELSRLYERRVRAQTSHMRQVATKLFQLMVFGKQHFTISQMRHAYALFTATGSSHQDYERTMIGLPVAHEFQTLLRKALAGLVEFCIPETGAGNSTAALAAKTTVFVQFIHPTVRKFLVSNGLKLMDPELRENMTQKSHYTILQMCLRIIELDGLREGYNDASPLQLYAGQYWAKHAGMGDMYIGDDEQLPAAIKRCTKKLIGLYKEARRAIPSANDLFLKDETSMVVILAAEGSSRIILNHAEYCRKCGVKQQDDVNDHDSRSAVLDRALFLATLHSRIGTIRCLRQFSVCKVDPNRLFTRSNAIYKACVLGQVEIVKILLEMGADIFQLISEGYRSCLNAAVACNNKEVVQELFDYHKKDIRRLLELRADSRTEKGFTALHTAARWDRKDTAKILLENIDKMSRPEELCHLRADDGRTAADIAEEHESEGVKMLLEEWTEYWEE